MWEMWDDVTSAIGSNGKIVKEIADRSLLKQQAKTAATEHLLQKKDVQRQLLDRVQEEMLKEFGVKAARKTIIKFDDVDEGEV